MSQKPLYAYVGTYTTENSKGNRNAHGVGIYVYEISRTNGRWKLVQEMPALNPGRPAIWKRSEVCLLCQ